MNQERASEGGVSGDNRVIAPVDLAEVDSASEGEAVAMVGGSAEARWRWCAQ